MIRLSGVVRRDTTSFNTKSATMSLLENKIANIPLDALSTSLPHLLLTIHTFIDPTTSVPRVFKQDSVPNHANEFYGSLIDHMRKTTNTVQERMGTQEYLKVMTEVQKVIKKRRDERRTKRKIEAITDPERWEIEKKEKERKQADQKKGARVGKSWEEKRLVVTWLPIRLRNKSVFVKHS